MKKVGGMERWRGRNGLKEEGDNVSEDFTKKKGE